jgi:predicted ribosome quality control (RQC) complex YloA/Tae2 family protein
LLPGATFVMPPKQENKLNPFIANQAYADLALKHTDVKKLKSELQTVYQGLASDTASYLATQLIDSDNTPQTYQEFLQHFDHPTPTLTKTPDGKVSFSVFKPDTIGEQISYPTLSALLDGFYTEKSQLDRTRQVAGQLIQIISNILKKDYSKIKKLNQTMEDTKKANQFRIKGEILTTYLHKIEPGMTEITLENFYDNNSPIKITLSNQLTASQNAQKYFTRYQKLRNAVAHVEEQLALTNQEVEYLESIQSQIELASPADTEEIKLELQQQGYLRENQNKKKKARVTISKPEEYTATDGTTILVGKNNLQNERLTFKVANKDDIWLHVKDIPGSHVVIRDSNPSDETIQEAANIAAYFSKGRDSAHVPVDYLPVKRLKKPAGTNPGFVTFTGQTTLSITPDSQKVNELRTK